MSLCSQTGAYRRSSAITLSVLCTAAFVTPSCNGRMGATGGVPGQTISDGNGSSADPNGGLTPADTLSVLPGDRIGGPVSRRSTRIEYDRDVSQLLGAPFGIAIQQLPREALTPFDNDIEQLNPYSNMAQAYELVASAAADRVDEDFSNFITRYCANPNDASNCYAEFISHFGKLALRRRLSEPEVQGIALVGGSVSTPVQLQEAVTLLVAYFLQHPEFVYRFEFGDGGTRNITDVEYLVRVSYFLWGQQPTEQLLNDVLDGAFVDPVQRETIIRSMIADSKTQPRMRAFHTYWLEFSTMGEQTDTLHQSFSDQAYHLIDRATLGTTPEGWMTMLTSQEMWIDQRLAAHFAESLPNGQPGWVPYAAEEERVGILAMGAFLGQTLGDSSPTRRAKTILERLLCQPPLDPPQNLNIDDLPEPQTGNCKSDRYAVMQNTAECASCHARMDPIGFGLEQYDALGLVRSSEDHHPECAISGSGTFVDRSPFSGVAQLSRLIIDSGAVESCLSSHLLQFGLGVAPRSGDQALLDDLGDVFRDSGHDFAELLYRLVTSEQFQGGNL